LIALELRTRLHHHFQRTRVLRREVRCPAPLAIYIPMSLCTWLSLCAYFSILRPWFIYSDLIVFHLYIVRCRNTDPYSPTIFTNRGTSTPTAMASNTNDLVTNVIVYVIIYECLFFYILFMVYLYCSHLFYFCWKLIPTELPTLPYHRSIQSRVLRRESQTLSRKTIYYPMTLCRWLSLCP
jgi:hypothetical protein